MGILRTILSNPRSTVMPEHRGGSILKKEAKVDPSLPIQHRKQVEFKPIVTEKTSKRFSNSNHPLIMYDSKPLEQVLEGLSFKKKPKRKDGMGVKLEI